MPLNKPDGYLAVPATATSQAVLVLHAWWGLNDTIKGICDRLAKEGFIAFAPDLYHGMIATTIPEAEALGNALDANNVEAVADIVEAVAFLRERVGRASRGLAVIAFSLGVYYTLELAARDPADIRSVVIFYGSGGEPDLSHSKADFLGHFAEHDDYVSQAEVDSLEQALQKAGRPVTFYHYSDTGHWFFEPDRTDAYNELAAGLAWNRTLAFLKRS